MHKHVTSVCLLFVILSMTLAVQAEKATDLYIPIGQSPGLGAAAAMVLGKIDRVNVQSRTITMSNAAGTYAIKLTERTHIYLDKSKAKRPNVIGSLADCKVRDVIEVKWEDNDRGKGVEWIKVQKTQ